MGIAIIATIMLLIFWMGIGVALAGWLNRPVGVDAFGMPVTGDYFSTGRLLFGAVFSVAMTIGTWIVADKLAD